MTVYTYQVSLVHFFAHPNSGPAGGTPYYIEDESSYQGMLEKLVFYAASTFGVNQEHLYSRSKMSRAKYVRWIVWYIMYYLYSMSLKDVATIFGKYDHSTVGNAIWCVQRDILNKPEIRQHYKKILDQMNIPEKTIADMVQNRKTIRRSDMESTHPEFQKINKIKGSSKRKRAN